MKNPNIIGAIDNIKLEDGSFLHDRITSATIREGKLVVILDALGIKSDQAKELSESITSSLEKRLPPHKASVILTSNKPHEQRKLQITGVRRVFVIASGKGGVGKSTVCALIAHKLAQSGMKTGIVDADIYGPSMPLIFGFDQARPEVVDSKMIPLESSGIKINSIGFLVDSNQSISWRGPMASKGLYQLLSNTNWGDLDYLLIDTPPGTGDVHLSLLQNYHIDGALIVTTPSKLAQIDVEKTIDLYRKFDIPICGIIENFSPSEANDIFGGTAGKSLSQKHGIVLAAQINASQSINRACDNGHGLDKLTDFVNPIMYYLL